MKILHVLTSPRAEGTPRLVLDWLQVASYDQSVLFLEAEPSDLLNLFPKAQIIVNDRLQKGWRKIEQIKRLTRKVCLKENPDVVICWNMGLSQWVLWGAKKANVERLIAHCGNAPANNFVGKYLFTYMTFCINRVLGAKIICCSEYIRRKYLQIPFVPKSMLYSVYNCLDVNKFRKKTIINVDAKVAIMVATLEAHKDHDTLLKSWKIIEELKSNHKLLIVGEGRRRGEIERLIKKLDLERVELLGMREDIPELLENSDVFAFSTTSAEGFGTVLVEALSVGLPIVATDVPACREILCAGKYGQLVPANDEHAFAQSLVVALNAVASHAEINTRHKYAEQFSPSSMIEKYMQIGEK